MPTPYHLAAADYLEAGWSPLPLPARQKSPVPTGYTGALGKYVTKEQLSNWLDGKAVAGKLSFRPGNVALRLPHNVIGVDVDAYGDKAGEATLAAAEEAWGSLPRTWVTTSREDGLSGIRLFRVPTDLAWPGQLPHGGGVELLRWDHRFAIVAPSIHDKTGSAYRWWKEDVDGNLVEVDEFPEPSDLPTLPKRWVAGLTNGDKWKDRPIDEQMDASGLVDWLAARPNPDEPCTAMRKTITDYARALRKASDDGGAHDAARDAAWAVLGDAGAGHDGVVKALGELRTIFLAAVDLRRSDPGAARAEWARIVLRGAQKVTADSVLEESDPCSSVERRTKGEGRRGKDWADLTELGNADRLVSVMAGRARWVEAWASWVIWSDTERIWKRDIDRQVDRWAVKAINLIEEEIGFLDNEKAINAYKSHIKSSLNVGKQRAMVEMTRARNGIIVPAEGFDADPRLLATASGTLQLGASGCELRESRQTDYLTLRTRVKYVPGARHALWSEFLKRFVPDVAIRRWLQKLAGYSLLGHNPARVIVFIVGPTSTGKTTFAEAIASALGELAGPMPASVLRDNADDKPRPDLLEALPRRVVIAEELSAAQHLHPDQIKRLTGGGVVAARGMRSNTYVARIPAFTPWLVTNSAPTISSADSALWRRILAVPFEQQIKYGEEVINFRERLATEPREAILAWLVEGYNAYAADPDSLWKLPKGAVELNSKLRDEMSDLDSFIAEACSRAPELRERPSRLYDAYKIWCDNNSISPRDRLSGTRFGKEIGAKSFDKKSVKIEGKPVWFRHGLALGEEYGTLV